VNDATFYPNCIKHTAYKRFIFDNKIITDPYHVTDQHIASFNCYWGYSLADTYLCTDGYHNKERIQFADHNCDNHMGS
jgi:hypothetical protein